ncbi:MAG TPA: flagellar motor protein MotB [Myxococcota bacterium]|nr:flagellar motor protein MotB [Myxococcota bacterium]
MKIRSNVLSGSAFGLAAILATACVGSGTHEAVVKERDQLKNDLAGCQTKSGACDADLVKTRDQNAQMVSKLTALGQNVEELTASKAAVSDEKAALAKEVEELRRLRASAEQRNAEYRKVMEKLNKMIDAGTLQVKIRNGRMVVQMSSDVVFPPGGIIIKPEAKAAIEQLAQTIKEFPDRKFQVVGHTDGAPIKTARFPSNWELSTQRAVEVTKLMVQAGVPAANISSAGNAEFDPLVANDTPENKTTNRRVEIVFMPKLDELPGFENVGK